MAYFPKYIVASNRRLRLYSVYSTHSDALKTAKYFQKKIRNNYFILHKESFFDGSVKHGLYMNKVYSLT